LGKLQKSGSLPAKGACMKTTVFLRETDQQIFFHFVCEGCGSEGELGLEKKHGMKSFGCPEGCGATYVPWKDEVFGRGWRLQCVVCPMFDSKEEKKA
jgi:hypothetical protein